VAAPALQTRARHTLALTARTSAPACTSTVQHSPAAGRAMVARCSGQLPQQGGSGAAGGGLSACRVCTTSRCISPLMSIASRLSHSQGSAGKVMSNCAHRPRPASFVRAHTARAVGALLPPRARRPCRCARAAALPRANEINKWCARSPAAGAPLTELHHTPDVVRVHCVHTRGDNDAREDDTDDGEQEDDLYFNRCVKASLIARVNACGDEGWYSFASTCSSTCWQPGCAGSVQGSMLMEHTHIL